MDKILYINSCVREKSRTNELAHYLLKKLNSDYKEIKLDEEDIKPMDSRLLKIRDELRANKNYSDDMFKYANDFKNANIIVISSPYWDLSFSALLKIYFENINIGGLTFGYNEVGKPKTLSNIKKVYYVTTAGGYIISDDYGFGYVKAMFNTFFEVFDIDYIKAEGLDIIGSDVDKIIEKAKMEIDNLF